MTKHYSTADGRRIAMRKGGVVSYFANDHLGGTAAVMDASGALVSRVRYYPYGQSWTQDPAAPPTDRLFTGQRRYGAKSGIYYYGARFYSADIGRFLSPDSIVPSAGDPQSLNRYSYVANNPLRYKDPSGHSFIGEGGPCTTTCTPQGPPAPTPPSGGVYGEAGVGGGVGFDPWLIVGQPDPYVGCGSTCSGLHTTWLYETYWAALALQQERSIDDLEWSWEQRGVLVSFERLGISDKRPEVGSLGDKIYWEVAFSWGLFGVTSGGQGPTRSPVLPAYKAGDKTVGVLQTPAGNFALESGRAGPGASMSFNTISKTHVEGHAAALMHQRAITEATLYINNPKVCGYCARNLPSMLPPGSQLTVVLPDGTVRIFKGNGR